MNILANIAIEAKAELHAEVIRLLEERIAASLAAADDARETATNKENAAENKYDTLGLEAAYLAHGQSERVLALQQDREAYLALPGAERHESVKPGSLVRLETDDGTARLIYIGPAAGGLSVETGTLSATVVTPDAPLGRALMSQSHGDEVTVVIGGKSVTYEITGLL